MRDVSISSEGGSRLGLQTTGKSHGKISGMIVAARSGIAGVRRAFGNREARDSGNRNGWLGELAGLLDADLTNLNGIAYGFAATRVDRPTRRRA
jgi:hypothetical protein